VFQNFLRDVLHGDEVNLGALESMREIPGLLAAVMAGTLVAFAESRIAAVGLVVAGIGIAISGRVHSFDALIAITVFWSIGFHLWATVQNAITLALAKGKEGGRHLGRMSGISAVATIGGLGFAFGISEIFHNLPYDVYFVLGGIAIIAAGLVCSQLSTHAEGGKRQRIVFRKEYGLFYILTFLEGCRRQIFSIFASFALILVYKVPVQHMLSLQFINAILISITAPAIGRLVDKIGEKGPLTFYSVGLIVVFLGYATFQTVGALYALFLLDNVLFSFGVGFTVYLHRIVRPGELTPCLAMGTTMNHIAAVTVPIGGALLWKATSNYQYPFWVGVGIAIISWIAMRFLPAGPIAIGGREEMRK
jgi:MFS family permease